MTSPESFCLETHNLCGGYKRAVPVCHDINLVCTSGDFLAILGPNGSGKTTLLRMLVGNLTPSSGRVLLNGRRLDTYGRNERAKVVAVVSQQSDVTFPFTVTEVVMLGRSPHHRHTLFDTPIDIDIAMAAMAEVNVLHLADKLFHECSGGEQKRTLIARALAQQPRILLLDEPMAGLDLHHQVALYEKLGKLARTNGLATIVISHDPWLPAQACNWAILLKDGRIVAQGEPPQVLTASRLGELYGVPMLEARSDIPTLPAIAVPCLPHFVEFR